MKLFKVWADSYTYDEYDEFIVAANSKEEIMEHLRKGNKEFSYDYDREFRFDDRAVGFNESQGEIHIEEVDLNAEKPLLVCASFNQP